MDGISSCSPALHPRLLGLSSTGSAERCCGDRQAWRFFVPPQRRDGFNFLPRLQQRTILCERTSWSSLSLFASSTSSGAGTGLRRRSGPARAASRRTVQTAYNFSVAQRELAAGLQDYYGALADQARAHAIRELVEAKPLALSSLPGQAGARRDAGDAAMAWPAPLDEKRFAADRQAANQVLLTWTVSPGGVRNVDKQRLRTALVSLHVKLKRRPTTASSVDYKVADEFLNSVARTVLGPAPGSTEQCSV